MSARYGRHWDDIAFGWLARVVVAVESRIRERRA